MKRILLTAIVLIATVAAFADGFGIKNGPYIQNVTEEGAEIFFTTSQRAAAWVEVYADGWEAPRRYCNIDAGLIDAYDTRHAVEISGLDAGCSYRYRIVAREMKEFRPYRITYGDSIATQWEKFSTLPLKIEKSRFVVINDGHDNADKVRSLLNLSQLKDANAVIYLGDMISYFENDEAPYKGFIDVSVELFARNKPFIAVRGNHETRGNLARRYKEYVGRPNGRFYNIFYFGNTALIVLDTGEDKPDSHPVYGGINDFDSYRREQALWLQQEIKSKRFRKCTNRIVLMHIPPFVTGDHGSENHAENELVELFTPIFNKAKIDLVLSGHTHRHYSIEPDGKRQFPIVINDNRSVMDLTSDKEGIGVTITDIDGNVTMNKKF